MRRPRIARANWPNAMPLRGPAANSPEPPPEPQYRWTFTTWIHREWRDWDGNRRTDMIDERTLTVIAPTEADAKRKIEAAIPAPPPLRDSFDARGETHTRKWQPVGAIEEVD